MERVILPVFLLFFLVSCSREEPVDLLARAREKALTARSFSYENYEVWRNTFVSDTTAYRYAAAYTRSEDIIFPYSFVWRSLDEDRAVIATDSAYYDLEPERRRVVNNDAGRAEDLGKESTVYYVSHTPYRLLRDTSGFVATTGPEADTAVFLRVVHDTLDDDRVRRSETSYAIARASATLTRWDERTIIDGVPLQHISREYRDQRWNEEDALVIPNVPVGYSYTTAADDERAREATQLVPGDAFPDLSIKPLAEDSIRLADLREEKVILIFSFIGCGGCEDTRKTLAANDFKLSPEYVGFYINPRDKPSSIAKYHEKKPWPFPLATIDYAFTERCGVFTYPTFITLDEGGVVTELVEGYDEAYFSSKTTR